MLPRTSTQLIHNCMKKWQWFLLTSCLDFIVNVKILENYNVNDIPSMVGKHQCPFLFIANNHVIFSYLDTASLQNSSTLNSNLATIWLKPSNIRSLSPKVVIWMNTMTKILRHYWLLPIQSMINHCSIMTFKWISHSCSCWIVRALRCVPFQ